MRLPFFLPLFLFACSSPKPVATTQDVPPFLEKFEALSPDPTSLSFHNTFSPKRAGGHLQGIQAYEFEGKQYALLSGSSNEEAYLVVVSMEGTKEVSAIHSLLPKPFKHAGGFQINGSYMAIGIEDNEAKDKSKVFVYELHNPVQKLGDPIKVIDRVGEVKRATAGCVGIAEVGEEVLMMVGDWDTRHLDIYRCPLSGWRQDSVAFQLVSSIQTDTIHKDWLSYQNINLIQSEGNLYFIGMGFNKRAQDIVDVYQVEAKGESFQLTFITRKKIEKSKGTHFRWGAGVYWEEEFKHLQILSCTEQLGEICNINIYE